MELLYCGTFTLHSPCHYYLHIGPKYITSGLVAGAVKGWARPEKGDWFHGWKSHTVRPSESPLASLECCLVTGRAKRRQSGSRVAMLLSLEALQSLKGRRSLSKRKTTSWYAVPRVYYDFGGVRGPIMFHNDQLVNWREPVIFWKDLSISGKQSNTIKRCRFD